MMPGPMISAVMSTVVTALAALAFLAAEDRLNNEFGFALLLLGPAAVAAITSWRARPPLPYIIASVAAVVTVGVVVGIENAGTARDSHALVVLAGTSLAIATVASVGALVLGALLAAFHWPRKAGEPS